MTVHPRRAREIARTRQDILEAAARAFARNGYQAVTMQEIAREAGYTAASLRALLPAELRVRTVRTYSRFFSHLLDTALNWAYLRGTRGRARSTAKGMVVTGDSHGMGGGGGRALRLAYPAMRAFAALDALLPWARGYMLLAVAEKVPSPGDEVRRAEA